MRECAIEDRTLEQRQRIVDRRLVFADHGARQGHKTNGRDLPERKETSA